MALVNTVIFLILKNEVFHKTEYWQLSQKTQILFVKIGVLFVINYVRTTPGNTPLTINFHVYWAVSVFNSCFEWVETGWQHKFSRYTSMCQIYGATLSVRICDRGYTWRAVWRQNRSWNESKYIGYRLKNPQNLQIFLSRGCSEIVVVSLLSARYCLLKSNPV